MASATATGRGGRKSQRGAPRSVPAPGHSHPAIPEHTPVPRGYPPRYPPASPRAARCGPRRAVLTRARSRPASRFQTAPRPCGSLRAPPLPHPQRPPQPPRPQRHRREGGSRGRPLTGAVPRRSAGLGRDGGNSLSRRRDRGRWAAAPLGYGRKNKMIK